MVTQVSLIPPPTHNHPLKAATQIIQVQKVHFPLNTKHFNF